MKLFKSLSTAMALTALLVPAIASASSTSTVDLQIDNFQVTFGGPVVIYRNGTIASPPIAGATRIDVTSVEYNGSNATSELNGTSVTDVTAPGEQPAFTLNSSIGIPAVNGAEATAALNNDLFTVSGADGDTIATASATGVSQSSADAQIINSFDAKITMNATNGDVLNNFITYDWVLSVMQSVFDMGGTTNGTYAFDISVEGSDGSGFDFNLLRADTGFGQNQALNTFGNKALSNSGSKMSALFDLLEGVTYTVAVNQTASVAATSVPAPGTIALFGGSILALALIRRRKVS